MITNSVLIALIHEENDDAQLQPVGTTNLPPDENVVDPGVNQHLETVAHPDDVTQGDYIKAGTNGVADSSANHTDISAGTLNVYSLLELLNEKVYNQALVHWVVAGPTNYTVNYDSSEDGGNNGAMDGDFFDHEEQMVLTNYYDAVYGANVFLIHMGSDTNRAGCAPKPDDQAPARALVFTGVAGGYKYKVIGHELGHTCYGLSHSTELGNLMYPSVKQKDGTLGIGHRLRKAQWFRIHSD